MPTGALDIIALPAQPGMFARRVAVQAWQSAGSPHANSAGRLYAEQKRLYDGWRLRKPGFNPADNPDDESEALAHVRFVAFDIDPTADRIRRLTAAGFHRPYTYEPWHWELPNVRSYALVRAIPATASLGVTPINTDAPTEQEEEEEMAQAGAFYRVASGQGVNKIYWQAEPNAPLLELDAVQWYTYEVGGAKFKDWAAEDLEPLMRRCGTYTLDKLGRIIRHDDGTPALWLPGLPA